ncbi:MAG: NYN domain-containing protein [Muribaculaceae bacterium]|nr:NYN domain-containing protein [Muribaculaceae bacterium]
MEKQRVIVYVDGFNFYFGLKKSKSWKKYYWLDIVKLFQKFMRPNQELIAVKYFSAHVNDLDKGLRQNAFFQANKENPKFNLILGNYMKKEIKCFNCGNIIHTYEEKESDVRMATQIVADAYKDNYDLAIVVSADSDMIPAIELAKETKHRVIVYFPPNQYSNNMSAITSCNPIQLKKYESRFKECILPDSVHLTIPDFDLKIPAKWKNYQTEK